MGAAKTEVAIVAQRADTAMKDFIYDDGREDLKKELFVCLFIV